MNEAERLCRQSSQLPTPTTPGSIEYRNPPKKTLWISESQSRSYIFNTFTCFYALFIVISGIVIELSNLIGSSDSSIKSSVKDLVIGIWLYGGSILFIGYCAYLVHDMHITVMRKRQNIRRCSIYEPIPEVLANSSTGSLYLRLGCVVFGIMGVVYYLLMFIVCLLGWSSHDGECGPIADTLNMLSAIFIFVQMWFVYCNGKIIFKGDGNLARIGLMHLTGTNLWMWLRYIIYEEVETIKEISHVEHQRHHHTALEDMSIIEKINGTCQGVMCVFDGYSEFMYTCVVEYSLICAGVAFVFWTNIERCKTGILQRKMKKRSLLKIDCSRTAEGLFAGFAVIIITIIAIALFNAYSSREDIAQWIFAGTNMIFFIISTFLVIFAFWRLRFLQFLHADDDEEDDNAELLDRILLVVGLIGELIFAIGGILSFANNITIGLPLAIFITNVLRLVQVTLQCGLIIVAGKLRLVENDKHMKRYKPGKQVITMLLIMNCAQFLMNVFEAQKAGINDEMIAMYGSYYWAIVVRGCSPLTIFFSSACFAEVWKKTFRPPKKPEIHG